MLTPMLPTVVKLAGYPLGGGTILDRHEKLLSVNPAALLFLTQTGSLVPTTIPCSKALKYFVLLIYPLNGTHAVHVSIVPRLKNL
jgi:hypothetical protein